MFDTGPAQDPSISVVQAGGECVEVSATGIPDGWWDDVRAAEEIAVAESWCGAEPGPMPSDDHDGVSWPELGGAAPGPELASRLVGLGGAELDDYDLIETVAAWERQAAYAQAQQVIAIAELLRRPLFARLSSLRDGVDPIRGVALEISARLRISVQEAERRVDLAHALTSGRSATLAALCEGTIDYWRARTLVEGVAALDDESTARAVESRLLEVAPEVTRSTLRHKVARAVAAADPTAAEQRHERAVTDRAVSCRPEPDGMGSIWALLSAPDAWLLDRVLDAAADRAAADPGDERTHAQRRADALAAMAWAAWSSGWIGGCSICGGCQRNDTGLAGATSVADARSACGVPSPLPSRSAGAIHLGGRSRRLEIGVLVPFSTLIGIDEQPAELVGYGPIPASVARRIAAEGTWRRILTDPAAGRLLDYGTDRYAPPQDLAEHVRLRDGTCRGVACTRPAASCDLDHTEPAPRGATSAANLCPLCRRHHNGKTHGGWQLAQPEPGHLRWRSPTGHEYDRGPEAVGPIVLPAAKIPPPEPDEDPPPF